MLPDLLHFAIGGGLLALVQAVLLFLNSRREYKAGANDNSNKENAKVSADINAAKAIERDVSFKPSSDVANELRDNFQSD